MSDKNIMDWIREHEGQKSRTDYFDIGNKTQHIVRYDNGDTYQHNNEEAHRNNYK